ncbi:RagB/SusD family nutrient uptake outer membrane protein [Olivibacter sp. SA151]|uniref:RagB/SusD family nutrient uptake outer membrane protein n=1 Tax=Olivibacter jilunii TaxID=985016 RepID=UPI003F13B3A1
MKIKNIIQNSYIFLLLTLTTSCSKFLEEKPESQLALVNTLADLQAIMDNETRRNDGNLDLGDIASDYYYLTLNDWQARNERVRGSYIWSRTTPQTQGWEASYRAIFDTNIVLENVDTVDGGGLSEDDRKRIKGEALFIRSWYFYHLLQVFAKPYHNTTLQEPGIPLRTTANINVVSNRATIEECYNTVLHDLNDAFMLLSDKASSPLRPSRAAVAALLSRCYLQMEDFGMALEYADICLNIISDLIDYNELDTVQTGQFQPLNREVIFHAKMITSSGVFSNNLMRVDEYLYSTYGNDDLRKSIFYKTNTDGALGFHGDYGGSVSTSSFSGIATDELYLTRAECYIREGNVAAGLADINHLLSHRYRAGSYIEVANISANNALQLVLLERRKELAFRGGIRWPDLRRLNKDSGTQQVLSRTLGENLYNLRPGEPGYVFLIPQEVIDQANLVQN